MSSHPQDRARRRTAVRPPAVLWALTSAALLSLALPGTAAADEPAETTVVGELFQAWAETDGHAHPAQSAPAPMSWVETAPGDAVPVEAGDVAHLPPGATVAVTVEGEPAAEGGSASPVVDVELLSAPPAPSTAGGPLTNQVTVAMVAPAGTPGGPRPAVEEVVGLVDGAVAEFWASETGGAVALGVTAAHGWIGTAADCSTPAALWNEVAGTVGFDPGPGRHLLLVVPPGAPGCAYALAEVGSSVSSGGRLYVSDLSSSVIAHELGHNFGLAHSSAEQCDGAVEAVGCRTVGYRDLYDVMGASWAQMGSLNVVHAAALGVLPEAHVQHVPSVAGSTTATLAPVSGRSGVRAVRLTDAVGVDYWLEYRPAAGRDAWLGTPADPFGLDTGVLLRREGTFPDTSVLLDGTPSPATGWDADRRAALPVGAPVTLAGGQFVVEVSELTADRAVVSVLAAPPAVPPGAPAPGPVQPPPGTVLAGSTTTASPGQAPSGAPTGGGEGTVAPVAAPAEASLLTDASGDREPVLAADVEPVDRGGPALTAVALGAALLGAASLLVRRLRRPARR